MLANTSAYIGAPEVWNARIETVKRDGMAAICMEFVPGETLARINSYELAYRMQMAAPEALDLARESAETHKLYGLDQPECAGTTEVLGQGGDGIGAADLVGQEALVDLAGEFTRGREDERLRGLLRQVEAVDDAREFYVGGQKIGSLGEFPPVYRSGLGETKRLSIPPGAIRVGAAGSGRSNDAPNPNRSPAAPSLRCRRARHATCRCCACSRATSRHPSPGP